MADQSTVWCRLISLNPDHKHVNICDDEVLFGRSESCHVRFENKKISNKHCRIYKTTLAGEVDERYFVEDLSTNGTFLNGTRVAKKTPVSIVNGNEISLTNPEANSTDSKSRVAYVFQDCIKLRREEEERLKKLQETVPTPLTSNHTEVDLQQLQSNQKSSTSRQSSLLKRQKTSDGIKQMLSSLETGLKRRLSEGIVRMDLEEESGSTKTPIKNDDNGSSSSDTTGLKRKLSEGVDTEENDSKRLKLINSKDGDETSTSVNKPSSSQESDKAKVTTTTTTTSSSKKTDEMLNNSLQENLVCGICHEILYKCVTLIPCMHNYCAYCYGEYKVKANKCPSCRQDVKFAQLNHQINNLIEVLLEKNPEWKRDKEELDDMDKLCKFNPASDSDQNPKDGRLKYLREKIRDRGDYDDDEIEDMTLSELEDIESEYCLDEESDDNSSYYANNQINTCQFCTVPCAMQSNFKCPPGGPHINCGGCASKIPMVSPTPVGQNCKVCDKVFCSVWKGTCQSNTYYKMGPLNTQVLTTMPPRLFAGNQFEQKIFQDYLAKNHLTFDSMWRKCLNDVEQGTAIAKTLPAQITSVNDHVCIYCAFNIFTKYLQEFRPTIPKDDLPDYAKNRDNCYYGLNCRTQFNKFDHAKKFNHVCPQTKFS